MHFLEEAIRRRAFLGGMAASAATLVAMGLSDQTFAQGGEMPPMPPPAATKEGFDAWIAKIQGTHKQVFDAVSVNHGLPLAWPRVFHLTSESVGATTKDVCAVVVLRHDAIPLGMSDEVWQKYKFADAFKSTMLATGAPITGQAFWKPKPGGLPFPGMSIDELMDAGVLFGICDMALTVNAMHFGATMKMDPNEVKSDWVANVLPGITIVPSGVLAVNRAQEAGCTYCYAGEG